MASTTHYHAKPWPVVKILIVFLIGIFYYAIIGDWLTYNTSLGIMLAFCLMMFIKHIADKLLYKLYARVYARQLTDSRQHRVLRYMMYVGLLLIAFGLSGLFNPWLLTVLFVGLMMAQYLVGRETMGSMSDAFSYLFIAIQAVGVIGMIISFQYLSLSIGLLGLITYYHVRYLRRSDQRLATDSILSYKWLIASAVAWIVTVMAMIGLMSLMEANHPNVYMFLFS